MVFARSCARIPDAGAACGPGQLTADYGQQGSRQRQHLDGAARGGVGRIIRFGAQAVNLSPAGFYNVEKPDDIGSDGSIRVIPQLLFPGGGKQNTLLR